MSEYHIFKLAGTSEVDVSVFESEIVLYRYLVLHLERRCLALGKYPEFLGDNLDGSCLHIFVYVSLCSGRNLSPDGKNILASYAFGLFKKFGG